MSEFLTEKELFQKTFGGTTFNHFIEWCKKMQTLNEHTQIHIRTLNPQESIECVNNSITRPDRVFFIILNKIVSVFIINTIENYMDLDKYFDRKCKEFGCDKYSINSLKREMSKLFLWGISFANENPNRAHQVADFLKNCTSHRSFKDNIEKLIELRQKRQKIWNENYIKFKGIDTDIFTPVYEYEMPYNNCFLFNGDDNHRIEFISKIVKHINFIDKLNYWQVDPETIKEQILRFDEVSISYPVRYLNKNEYKY